VAQQARQAQAAKPQESADERRRREAMEADARARHVYKVALGSSEALGLFRDMLLVTGRALHHDRHDAYEAGRRDYARQILAAVRRFAPDAYEALVRPEREPPGAEQAVRVRGADDDGEADG